MKHMVLFTAIVIATSLCAFGGESVGYGTDAYAKKGLIAIWDGIENAGMSRQHSSDIVIWKDVIGDRAFELTGVTIDVDGLVFSGAGSSSRGVLSAADAAATFGLAGNGTLEIVLIPDETPGQRIALQGPKMNSAGLSIGIDSANRIFMQNEKSSQGFSYNWRGVASTFSMMYSASMICLDKKSIYRNGVLVPADWYTTIGDYWGSSDSCAYVGGRCSGADGFSGKICCVRLYDRRLTSAEVAANAEVDRIRYREKPGNDKLVIAGDPANYGNPTPGYGMLTSSAGVPVEFNVGDAIVEQGTARMTCVGHRVLRVNVNGGWEQEGEDSAETVFSYEHDGEAARKIEWIWHVSDQLGVEEPELVTARRLSAEFCIRVTGAGYDDFGARLCLAWGPAEQQLGQTNVVATVDGPCDCCAHLTRVKPIDYYVQAVLEKLNADGDVESVIASEVVRLPADKVDDEQACEYVQEGLIAWWDGVYNGGADKSFDGAPTVWKDVVGNIGFSVNGYAPSKTCDSMVFTGAANVYGVLSEQDTVRTFDKCSSGTLEIVARGANKQAIALRGSDASGIAFGPMYQDGKLHFIVSAATSGAQPTVPSDWSSRRTFAIRYDNKVPQDALVDGDLVYLTTPSDFWGNGGDGTRAYIGTRAGGSSPLDGEICAVRLYDRQLTDEEAMANSIVDDNRFRGRLTHDCLEITGSMYEYGSVSPAYGHYLDLANGASVLCSAPAEVLEGATQVKCTGWQLLTNAVDDTSVWLPWLSGDGTDFVYVHKAGLSSRLVWQWQASGGGELDLGTIGFEDIQTDSFNVRASVLGIGNADSGTLKVKWGCSPDAMVNEVSKMVTGIGDFVFRLDGLLPRRRYFVQVELSAEGSDSVVSDIKACSTSDGFEPQGTRERFLDNGLAYVSSVVADGWLGDGVAVTGKIEFPADAGDCDWGLIVWKAGETDVLSLMGEDVTIDDEGCFSLTVVTDDPDADDYLQPGQQYELAVVTDLGNGDISASPICDFVTAAGARFDGRSINASVNHRELTVVGNMLDVGAGGVAKLTLMVGEGVDDLAEVREMVVRDSDLSFSFTYATPEVERGYWWTVRCVNESAGKTVCWTNMLPISSIFCYDTAYYKWTGAAGNGLWSDRGNWVAQRSSTDSTPLAAEDCVGYPCAEKVSAQFPERATSVVLVDQDVTFRRLSLGAEGADVSLTSKNGKTMTVSEEFELFTGGTVSDPTVKVFDGVKIVASGSMLKVGNGSRVVFLNGAELTCSSYRMGFDGGSFDADGVGTNLTVVGEGCKIKTTGNVFLASESTCIVSNGTLDVGGNLLFNCETDGGKLCLEGDRPSVIVKGECRSTNEPRQLTASGGILFDIPTNGYVSVPIILESKSALFGGTDEQACQPLHLSVVKNCGAYRNAKTSVYPLVTCNGAINPVRQVFDALKRPQTSAFVYSCEVDEPVWETRDELLPSATPKLIGVRLGAACGLVILLF